jgi:tetratricopeptide (TPR) repeat protein
VKLTGEATATVVSPTADLTAYDLYLKGRHAVNQRSGGSLVQAVDYFEQAIARDRRFAQAFAGMADAYVLLPSYSATNSAETWPKGRADAERALELDSTRAEAHTTLAYGKFLFDRDWRAAEQGFRRAIALNPGYATAHHWYGDYLGGRGNLEGYLQELRHAPLPGPGGHYPVSADGGATPVWSPDGRRVFYTKDQTLFAATVSFSPTFSVTARDTIFRSGIISVPVHASYDVAPDGKHFVILRSTGPDAQLIIVHDWKYELRARFARSTPR